MDPRGVSDARLLEGLDAYARHDARAAEHQLANARAGGREESVRRLFLASAVLARGDERRAAALIESVDLQRDLPEPWRAEGLRTLALAWRRSGRVAQADSLASLLEATGSGEKR